MRKFNVRWWIDLPRFVPTVPTVVKWHGFSWDEIEAKMLRLSE